MAHPLFCYSFNINMAASTIFSHKISLPLWIRNWLILIFISQVHKLILLSTWSQEYLVVNLFLLNLIYIQFDNDNTHRYNSGSNSLSKPFCSNFVDRTVWFECCNNGWRWMCRSRWRCSNQNNYKSHNQIDEIPKVYPQGTIVWIYSF